MGVREVLGAVGATVGLGSAAVFTTQMNDARASSVDVSTAAARTRFAEVLERELDFGTLNWAPTPPDGGQFVTGDGASYLVERDGLVREYDPDTYAAGAEVDLGGVPGLATLAEGRLVVPMTDGRVKVLDGGEVVVDEVVAAPGDHVSVSLVGDLVVLLNHSARELRRLDLAEGAVSEPLRPDLPEGVLFVPAELPGTHLWIFAGRVGRLVGVDLTTGRLTVVPLAGPDGAFLAPVPMGDHLVLVDRAGGGTILEVDPLASQAVVHTEPLQLDDTSQVDVVAQDGRVYVNDRGGALAVVIEDGQYTRVDKFADPEAAADLPAPTGAPPSGVGDQPVPPTSVDCGGDWMPCS